MNPRPEPLLSRWTLLWVCLGVVALLLIAWEIVEHAFFPHADPRLMHRLYLYRDVFGAAMTTLVAVGVVLNNWERAQGEIIKRDRFLASIVNTSGDAIVVLDAQGVVLFWNKAAEGMLGYPMEEAVGKDFRAFGTGEQDHEEKFQRLMRGVREQGAARDVEIEKIHKSGRRLLVGITATQIKDETGAGIGAAMLMRDITRGKMLQDKTEQADRVAVVGQLAASMAHEIGTPLNVISGNAEYLLGSEDTQRSPGKELKIIVEETERISKLIKRLMHITQPQSLDMKEVHINAIVQRVLEFTAHEMEGAKVMLESHLDKGLPAVLGDADQLEQVLLNLVMNAIEAMPGGGRLFVATSLWRMENDSNALVQVRVSDTGTGIPKEIMAKIFDPFFTTKKVRGYGGLGLSISSRIIEDHKGTIKIESSAGKGTSITVRLPPKETLPTA